MEELTRLLHLELGLHQSYYEGKNSDNIMTSNNKLSLKFEITKEDYLKN